MATKLSLYNGACALLGETPLSSLSENRSVRFWLDRAWDDGAINTCLEQGKWGFATRSQQITQSSSIIPSFGPQYAFELPSDFKGLNGIWSDQNFLNSIDNYYIEAGVIYCDWDTIYVKYISNAATYGNNLAVWPETFARYVESYLAKKVQQNVVNSPAKANELDFIERNALMKAKDYDKKSKPRQRMQAGNWVTSRTGYGNNYVGSGYYGANGF